MRDENLDEMRGQLEVLQWQVARVQDSLQSREVSADRRASDRWRGTVHDSSGLDSANTTSSFF